MWIKINKDESINMDFVTKYSKTMVVFSDYSSQPISVEEYEIIDNALFKKRKTKNDQPSEDLFKLFQELNNLTGGSSGVVFTPARERKLKELTTKHRLTIEDVKRAATNIGQDSFLQGENDNNKRYGDIDYLLRPDKAAKYASEQTKKKRGMF